MATPWTLVDSVADAITLGTRATWVAVAGIPRSTIVTDPDPPGVTTAQFSWGSTAIAGVGPVLTGRVFVFGVVEQLFAMLASEPPNTQTNAGGLVERSITAATFVLEYATTARCVSEFTPIEEGNGAGVGTVGLAGRENGVT